VNGVQYVMFKPTHSLTGTWFSEFLSLKMNL